MSKLSHDDEKMDFHMPMIAKWAVTKGGKLSERELYEVMAGLDLPLMIREDHSTRGVVAKALKRHKWTRDTLKAAGITAYIWHPPKTD